jgi:hypothetical protein
MQTLRFSLALFSFYVADAGGWRFFSYEQK